MKLTSSEPYVSAMEERLSDPGCIVEKPFIEPIAAYDFHQESRTLEELEQIQFDTDALHMESLVIRERILGPYNPELTDPIIYRCELGFCFHFLHIHFRYALILLLVLAQRCSMCRHGPV